MTIKKDLLCLIVTLISVWIGPSIKTLLLVGSYYIITTIIYVTIGVIYESKYMVYKRRITKIKQLIDSTISDMPLELTKLRDWLKKEGFVLRIKDTGALYLQSNTTKVDYFHSFEERVFISALQKENVEYLVYEDDEVLKKRMEDYLAFLTEKDKKIREADSRMNFLNRRHMLINENHTINSHVFWNMGIRLQGYIFLIIALMNIPEDSYPNIYKLATFVIYFLFETYEKRA